MRGDPSMMDLIINAHVKARSSKPGCEAIGCEDCSGCTCTDAVHDPECDHCHPMMHDCQICAERQWEQTNMTEPQDEGG